jgi:RNA polymerase-binding protein DksA
MNKKSLDIYRKLLLKLREDIAGDIKNMRDEPGDIESKDVSGHVIHMADVATDMYDKEFNMGLESKDRVLLQKIEEALRRIENGTYGVCLATGRQISQARLKAIPYAEYCLEYQEELESKSKYRQR